MLLELYRTVFCLGQDHSGCSYSLLHLLPMIVFYSLQIRLELLLNVVFYFPGIILPSLDCIIFCECIEYQKFVYYMFKFIN